MTDYSKTKIYRIESHLGDKIYVGSTAKQYLSQRFQGHKNAYKRWKENKDDRTMTSFVLFDEYGIENCQIVLIEEFACSCKDAKNAREGHYIKTLNCVNKHIMGRSHSEYYVDNKEQIKEVQKKYQESDKYKEALKKYKESGKGKETLKKYQETDKGKEARKKAQKQYYERKKAMKLKLQNKSEPIII